jgi:hypothetical protein
VYGLAPAMDERADRVKRQVVMLVVMVLLVDGIFIGGYFAVGLIRASVAAKVGYTAIWTLVTMVVVLRGLSRIRSIKREL